MKDLLRYALYKQNAALHDTALRHCVENKLTKKFKKFHDEVCDCGMFISSHLKFVGCCFLSV